MEYRILGPLEVLSSDGPVEVRGAKPRALLALLLVHANDAVRPERLIEDLWEGSPPRSAAATLQTYVSQLRKALRLESLRTRPAGYILEVESGELDALDFERALHETSRAEDPSPAWVAARLEEALAWWRGPALADFEGVAWAQPEIARLEELRLGAIEDRVEARLTLGEHATLVHELESLIAEHPYRERLWRQFMLALYRSDRQAEALRAYGRLRRQLGEELGIEPSKELARLEQRILLQEPALDWQPFETRISSPVATLPSGVVTFLLTDIVGSTALWEQERTAMAAAVERHDTLIGEAVSAHGGTLLKARGEGDSTFSVFARASHALEAALSAQRALVDEPWSESAELSVRMALHTGEALERDGDYYGPTVNRAARIRNLAAGGQVLLSQSTAEVVRDDLPEGSNLVELGEYELRDLTRAERVCALTAPGLPEGRRPTAMPERPASELPLMPPVLRSAVGELFVGRAAALETLMGAWKDAEAGNRRVVLIAGEPGIGKTRLAAELASAALERGAVVLYGRCDEDLGVPYQPWIEALSTLVAHAPGDVLADAVALRGSELARLVPELAHRIGTQSPARSSDRETERYLLYGEIVGLVARVSVDVPVLLVLEDLHWADTASLPLLRHLIASADPRRLLVVGTYRATDLGARHPLTDVLAALHRERGIDRVELSGLSAAEVVALLEAAAGRRLDDEEIALAHGLHRETDGNPFFSAEIVRHLTETGAVSQREDGRWIADLDFRDHGALPTSVREVIGRRVARLGEETTEMLETAAVIGRDFELELLARVTDRSEDRVVDLLEGAVRAMLIHDAPDRPGRLTFSHALTEHTLYDGIAPIRRQRLHLHVGARLEALYGDDSGERLSELAYHWTQASTPADAAKAIDYALRAADDAVDRLAPEEAIRWYRQALELLDRHRARDETTRCRALVGLGFAQRPAGDAEYRQTLLDAASLAERLGNTTLLVQAALGSGARGMAGDVGEVDDERVGVLEAAVGATARAESPERANLLGMLGSELTWVDPERAGALSDEALAMARRLGDDAALWSTLGARFNTIWSPATLDERSANAREQWQAAERLDNPYFREGAAGRLLMAAAERGDLDEVDEYLDMLTRWVAEGRPALSRASAALFSAWRRLLAGDIDGAEQAADEARRLGTDWGFGFYAAQLYEIRRAQGRLGEIIERLERAVAKNPNVPFVRARVADALCELGRLDDALIVFEPLVVSEFQDLPFDTTWLPTIAWCAEVAARLQLREASAMLVELLAPWRGRFVCTGITCSGSVARPLGLVLAAADRLDEADDAFAEAAAVHQRIDAPIELARTRVDWAHVLMMRGRRGDHDQAREQLGLALSTAENLGLATIKRRAQALLGELTPA
jgi:DNA-binding SARP family transcriptional activator/tetratricopeptide (TPR) repeat protein